MWGGAVLANVVFDFPKYDIAGRPRGGCIDVDIAIDIAHNRMSATRVLITMYRRSRRIRHHHIGARHMHIAIGDITCSDVNICIRELTSHATCVQRSYLANVEAWHVCIVLVYVSYMCPYTRCMQAARYVEYTARHHWCDKT